jgi:hypothetical protein
VSYRGKVPVTVSTTLGCLAKSSVPVPRWIGRRASPRAPALAPSSHLGDKVATTPPASADTSSARLRKSSSTSGFSVKSGRLTPELSLDRTNLLKSQHLQGMFYPPWPRAPYFLRQVTQIVYMIELGREAFNATLHRLPSCFNIWLASAVLIVLNWSGDEGSGWLRDG